MAQAHPFKDDYFIRHKYPVNPRFVDAIEVFNSNVPKATNDKAMAFAKKHNLPMQTGTDSHGRSGMYLSGIRLTERADNIFDIINAIKTRKAQLLIPTA